MVMRAKLMVAALLCCGFLSMPALAQYGNNPNTYMETRVSDLETQIRTLNGRLEQAEWQNKKMQAQLERLQGDVEMRLGTLEQERAEGSSAGSLQLATPRAPRTAQAGGDDETMINRLAQRGADDGAEAAPAKPVTGRLGNIYMSGNKVTRAEQDRVQPELPKKPAGYGLNAQEQYDGAFGLLRNADYDGAEAAFQAFISKNPKDKLVDNAKYWLGETHFARQQYDAAAVAFADAYQSAPKGSKAPDSLLKLGLSLAGLKKTEDACTTLGEVGNRYPNAPGSIKNRTAQEMKKLKCKS